MHRAALLITVLAVVLIGCSDDSSTEPDPPDETPLAEETIGSSGGTLETEDFVLTVPPGAFGSSAELKLYESSEDHGFDTEAVSRDFRLEGFPDTFTDSVTVRILYNGTLDGESFVAVGSEETVMTYQFDLEQEVMYELLPAHDAAGYLEAKLPPREAGLLPGATPAATKTKQITAISDYDVTVSDYIHIEYPRRFEPFINELIGYFEAAHDITVDLGIGYDGKTWDWPATATVMKCSGGDKRGSFLPREKKAPRIKINGDYLTTSRLPEFMSAALVGMLATGMAIPRFDLIDDPDLAWWHTAVIWWAEMKYGGPAAPTRPEKLPGNESKVFTGLPYGFNDYALSVKYGFSWAALVDFLTERDGTEIVPGIYSQIKAGIDPVTALLTRLPDPEYLWWPDFVHRYVTGGYYGIESSLFLTRIDDSKSFSIGSKADSVKVFPHEYTQLSAQLHRIELGYSQIPEDATLRLQLDTGQLEPDYAVLKVYKAKDGILTFLSEGRSVTVPDLRDLTVSGYDIIPIVMNCYTNQPYDEKTSLTLDLRVIEPVGGYTKCSVEAWLIASFREGSYDPVDELWLPSFHAIGSMTNNTYTGTFDPDFMPPGMTGTVTVTLDPVTKALLSYSCTGHATGSEGSSSWSLSGSGVPQFQEDPGRILQYLENGLETCNHVSNTDYIWSPNSGDGKVLVEYWCDDLSSEIKITFRP